jgi:hypothetical protein
MTYGRSQPLGEDLRAAEKEWKRLGKARRKEVLRLSKHGEVHPDPRVAEIAYREWLR